MNRDEMFSSRPTGPYTAYMGMGKRWLFAGLALLFVVLGCFVAYYSYQDQKYFFTVIGVLCIVFFGFCLLYIVSKLNDRTPAVVVDEDGITDRSSYIAGGLIRWEEIRDIELYEFMNQSFIGIELYDSDSYLEKQRGLRRLMMNANRGMVQATINISQSSLSTPLEELYDRIIEQWERRMEKD
ncbi:hypothetical protein DCC85_04540 [Paenibacillus sp. CAA11]|uniref:STM3941 family protein n=1 Tax=Paenibacillus sp. CAA11 TaxID=1532905 RepID=UPI000D3A17B9|nr:STM3941 family protein [Paenibacillus sp. CAA11]AWB43562.1 hypothetical protein DCC85_04540 [Paenibacillus sp. CAA11]